MPSKLHACIGFLYKVVHKTDRFAVFIFTIFFPFNFQTANVLVLKFGTLPLRCLFSNTMLAILDIFFRSKVIQIVREVDRGDKPYMRKSTDRKAQISPLSWTLKKELLNGNCVVTKKYVRSTKPENEEVQSERILLSCLWFSKNDFFWRFKVQNFASHFLTPKKTNSKMCSDRNCSFWPRNTRKLKFFEKNGEEKDFLY